jgi:hypothetical protein
MKLANGRADLMAMVKSGMNVALGTDSTANVNSLDLFRQMRQAALLVKDQTGDPAALNASTALLLATVCGAKAQGRSDSCGMIKVGMDADLAMLDFTQPHLIPCHNLISNAVYAADGHDVCMTMVRGKILYAAGKYTTIDLSAVMKELAEHAALSGTVLGLGAGDGCHHQHSGGRHGGSIAGFGSGSHSGIAHDFKHVQIAALLGTPGTQCHIHAGLDAVQNGRGTVAAFGVSHRCGNGGNIFLSQQLTLVIFQICTACSGGRYCENIMAVQ